MLDYFCLRDGVQDVDRSESCVRRRRAVVTVVVVVEHGVATIAPAVTAEPVVVGRGIDDDFFVAVALDGPRRVEVIKRVEEGGNKVHRDCAQEDEEDIASQSGSS